MKFKQLAEKLWTINIGDKVMYLGKTGEVIDCHPTRKHFFTIQIDNWVVVHPVIYVVPGELLTKL